MTDIHSAQSLDLPGSDLDVAKMPGHWLLARLGKRVLRPGGLRERFSTDWRSELPTRWWNLRLALA